MALPILDVPTYEVEVPSSGKKIKFRPFLVKEHKVLMTLAEASVSEVAETVKDLVRACTFEKVDINKLAHFDIEYLFLQLRAKSIGEMVDVVINCECGNKIDHTINLTDAKVTQSGGKMANKIQLTPTVGIQMRYPKFEEVASVFESKDQSKILSLVTSCVEGVYTDTEFYDASEQTPEEIEEFLNNLTKDQFDKVENFFVDLPRLVQHIEADCGACGKHNDIRLEGLENFFV